MYIESYRKLQNARCNNSNSFHIFLKPLSGNSTLSRDRQMSAGSDVLDSPERRQKMVPRIPVLKVDGDSAAAQEIRKPSTRRRSIVMHRNRDCSELLVEQIRIMTEISDRLHKQVRNFKRDSSLSDFLWITRRGAAFPINSDRLDASVFTSMLPATERRSRTCATRATEVFFIECTHCSRIRRHTQVDIRTRRKNADKTHTIARERWHGARKRKCRNVRSIPIFRPVTFLVAFGVVLVAFGVASVAPLTGWCVIVAYESRARWRSPSQHNHNDVLVPRSRRADDVPGITRERCRE